MSLNLQPFTIQSEDLFIVPVIHHNMETALAVRKACEFFNPSCIAVEINEKWEKDALRAAARLPDISIIVEDKENPIYYLCEPCDPSFEALRSAIELGIPAHCIDLNLEDYPNFNDLLPDPYAIFRIGLKDYYEAYLKNISKYPIAKQDTLRELHMAKRLKDLVCRYGKVLFVTGFSHANRILTLFQNEVVLEIPLTTSPVSSSLVTVTEQSLKEILPEYGWIASHYEQYRLSNEEKGHLDRQKLIYQLCDASCLKYKETYNQEVFPYQFKQILKFAHRYAFVKGQLLPDLYQLLIAARGCVDDHYAHVLYELATSYPYYRNIDSLPELDLSAEDLWKASRKIKFHFKEKSRKLQERKERTQQKTYRFNPSFEKGICSYPPEDLIIEKMGDQLKKRAEEVIRSEQVHAEAFTTSLEDGIDVRMTIRNWHEKKIYVKLEDKRKGGKPGSVVLIFNEDVVEEGEALVEKYPWKVTWLGEHAQESDMSFFATSPFDKVVGPGISRCEYGGFLLAYPRGSLGEIWNDSDYSSFRSKAEVLLAAAIDYAVSDVIVYMAKKPPRPFLKQYARRFGKKVVYLPLGQFSHSFRNKVRFFHVLDGHDKREIADDYIF